MPITTINASIEESLLRERDHCLLAQDEFVRDHLTSDDVLVVSVGGNDIALSPSASTIRAMLDAGSAWGMSHMVDLFSRKIADLVERVTAKHKPKAVVVCMI